MSPTRRPLISDGVLAYRRREGAVEFLLVQPGGPYWRGKDVAACVARAWMTEADFDLGRFHSNDFEAEWPPRFGQRRRFAEVDRAAYIPAQDALRKVHRSLRPILLEAMTGRPRPWFGAPSRP